MRDLPREQLRELLGEHGPSLLSMQGTFGMLMRQRCPGHESEVEALVQALQSGVAAEISQLRDRAAWDEAAERWTQQLAASSGDDEAARWAVDSWGRALGKHPDSAPMPSQAAEFEKPWDHAPFDPIAPPTSFFLRSGVFWQLILVAAAGCVGGLTPALELWHYPVEHFVGPLPGPAVQEEPQQANEAKPDGIKILKLDPQPADAPAAFPFGKANDRALRAQATVEETRLQIANVLRQLKERPDFLFFMAFLAAVGAATGGTIGFMLGSGGSGTLKSALSGSTLGTIGLGVFWTFQAGYAGGLVGLLFHDTAVSFFAAGIAALFAGGLGGFIGKYIPALFYCWVGLMVVNLVFGFASLEGLLLQM